MAYQIWAIKKEAETMLKDEESYWSQRAKSLWLAKGGKNTKYFHAKASLIKKNNSIWGVKDSEGVWHPQERKVEEVFCFYFEDIFKSTNSSQQAIDEVLNVMPRKVTDDMNDKLTALFTDVDVRFALMQMHPSKSSGLDGLLALFLTKYWDVVKSSLNL